MFLLPERSKKLSKNRSNRCLNRQETSSKLESSSLQNIAFATPKHHATEGRTYASNPQASKTLASPLAFPCLAGSCLLPLASYSFLCFLSSCSISFPVFSDALPLLSAGVGGYVCIHKVLAITPGQARSCRVETDMVVESLGKWQSLAQHLICRYSVCWLQWAKAWFIHCFFNQSRTGERSACWSSHLVQVKKLKRSIRVPFLAKMTIVCLAGGIVGMIIMFAQWIVWLVAARNSTVWIIMNMSTV